MKYQGLVIVSFWFLAQCTPSQKEEGVSVPSSQQEILDPNVYTISAYVQSVPLPDQAAARISGKWLDGAGEFSQGNDFAFSWFRHTLPPAQRYQPLQFSFTLNDAVATSESISFKDCDFTTAFGYSSADFRHMILNYNFFEGRQPGTTTSTPTPIPTSLTADAYLERAPLASSGPDAKAVQCERVTSRALGRTVNIRLKSKFSEPTQMESKGQIVTLITMAREGFFDTVTQEFAIDLGNGPLEDAGQDVTIRMKTGTYPYHLSFKRCIDLLGNKKDLLTSQSTALFLDQTGKITEGSTISCCTSDGTCLGVTAGLK